MVEGDHPPYDTIEGGRGRATCARCDAALVEHGAPPCAAGRRAYRLAGDRGPALEHCLGAPGGDIHATEDGVARLGEAHPNPGRRWFTGLRSGPFEDRRPTLAPNAGPAAAQVGVTVNADLAVGIVNGTTAVGTVHRNFSKKLVS